MKVLILTLGGVTWLREETECITRSAVPDPGHTAAEPVLNRGIGTQHEKSGFIILLDMLLYSFVSV